MKEKIIRNVSRYERFEEIVQSMRHGAKLSFDEGKGNNPITPKITAISRKDGVCLYVLKGSGLINNSRLLTLYKNLAQEGKNVH